MMRWRLNLSAIIPDSGATSADGTCVNKKLADSHPVEPVLANTAKDSATLAAQLPAFDAAEAPASSLDIAPRTADHYVLPAKPRLRTPTELHGQHDCQSRSSAAGTGLHGSQGVF